MRFPTVQAPKIICAFRSAGGDEVATVTVCNSHLCIGEDGHPDLLVTAVIAMEEFNKQRLPGADRVSKISLEMPLGQVFTIDPSHFTEALRANPSLAETPGYSALRSFSQLCPDQN